jgi:hypothetical protein
MRLVNKEFENKVSRALFRVVVVPFKPEIYGIAPGPQEARTAGMVQGSVMLQDKGMKVFQGFGGRIQKFAMSFEFEESRLAAPPVKSDQEAITSFWGIYRWPFKQYNRYSQLEGLEQTADETGTMAEALRFVTNAEELGLSIDGGLGWIAGPDINLKVIERGDKPVVFGESRFVPEPKPKVQQQASKSGKMSNSSSHIGSNNDAYSSFQRILREAGYHGESLEPSFRLLLESEELPGESQIVEASSGAFSWETRIHRGPQALTGGNSFDATNAGDSTPLYQSEEDEDTDVLPTIPSLPSQGIKSKTDGCSLKPNDLTNAQREMLLEIEWAQRAFMQSYAIAIIDNRLTFQGIRTLTIARLPNRHLPILRRKDFWDSLPQLNTLSLAIIPDWRDVVKLPTSWVQDIKVLPSQSVTGVYQLLLEQISKREKIKTLHFEWLCGGEEASGLFARNQHILAAPLASKAMDMVNRVQLPQLLSLPYVEHLSLKNCWISPHVLSRFLSSCKVFALQSLTFNSVSLTAPLPTNAQPNPVVGQGPHPHNAQQAANQAVANNLFANLQVLGGLAAQHPPAPLVSQVPIVGLHNQIPGWLEAPRTDSWAHIIDKFSPGSILDDLRYARGHGEEPPPRTKTNLTRLHFKSCGYVRLPLDFDQTMLEALVVPAPQVTTVAKKISDIDCFMMKSNDHSLGTIVNHISAAEAQTLEKAFGMTLGWDSSSALAVEAMLDGISNPGDGRFGGTIEVRRSPSY